MPPTAATPDLPALPLAAWRDTYATLHMCSQIVGKIQLKLTPFVNHWWNATFFFSARGLTSSAIPFGDRVFEIEFDFLDHQVHVRVSDGATARSRSCPAPWRTSNPPARGP